MLCPSVLKRLVEEKETGVKVWMKSNNITFITDWRVYNLTVILMSRSVLLKLGTAAPQGAMKHKSGSHKIFKYLKKIIFTVFIHSKN
jgi:hypothetical protein